MHEKVNIALIHLAKTLGQKYEYDLPKMHVNHFNEKIKKIAEPAGLDEWILCNTRPPKPFHEYELYIVFQPIEGNQKTGFVNCSDVMQVGLKEEVALTFLIRNLTCIFFSF